MTRCMFMPGWRSPWRHLSEGVSEAVGVRLEALKQGLGAAGDGAGHAKDPVLLG